MSALLYTFMDIFNNEFQVEEETVQLKKIVIPIIQRDYAQGRKNSDINRVRERFLDSLHLAVTDKPITLDFIYGDIDEDGVMYPLDGQQRLTTLFLLHWYAAKKEEVPKSEYSFLYNFSYETRYSARDFCNKLIEFTPAFQEEISKEIINQYWFPLDWKKDPTISSMLVVLDAIHNKFYAVNNLWGKLKEKAITFYFLAIKDMGLTDELYIKMNSRGKPLTQFEHFKAELERKISLVDKETSQRISRKIDRDWTELLWQYRGSNNIIDDEFLRYFKFICDIICYKNGGSPQGKSNDEFDLLNEYFTGNKVDVINNITIFENYFDCWCSLGNETPSEFLKRFISHKHEAGKIKIDNRDEIDIFKDCLKKYSDISGRRRAFPLNRIVLLYGIISYLLNKSKISEAQFARRIRIINNLIMNSEYEISDSEARSSGNRMPAILKQVDYIMTTGEINFSIENNFSVIQLTEEQEKITWLENNPEKSDQLFALEDHSLLQGQIGILGLENFEYFARFKDLFECDRDKVDCALMAIDFYGQQEQNRWRYQLGSSSIDSAWRELFHRSRNRGFERTKETLKKLLSRQEEINDEYLERIITEYINYCEENSIYSWRYYYIKYPVFRPRRYGKYFNRDLDKNLYMFGVMATQSKMSSNSYMPFLKEADSKNLSKDDFGKRLIYGDRYIECLPNAFVVKSIEDDSVVEEIMITQNEEGIDVENRIEKLRSYIQQMN
jgi:hypothetical protein